MTSMAVAYHALVWGSEVGKFLKYVGAVRNWGHEIERGFDLNPQGYKLEGIREIQKQERYLSTAMSGRGKVLGEGGAIPLLRDGIAKPAIRPACGAEGRREAHIGADGRAQDLPRLSPAVLALCRISMGFDLAGRQFVYFVVEK
jgi:hypothetical protein